MPTLLELDEALAKIEANPPRSTEPVWDFSRKVVELTRIQLELTRIMLNMEKES